MNCDQAFDAMTDPRGRQTAAMLSHLESCSRCRQMRETLAPALGVLKTERVMLQRPDETAAVGTASPAAVHMAQRLAARLAPDPTPAARPARQSVSRAWGFLLAACGGALVAIGTLLVLQPPTATPQLADECLWQRREKSSPSLPAQTVVRSCVSCHLSRSAKSHAPLEGTLPKLLPAPDHSGAETASAWADDIRGA